MEKIKRAETSGGTRVNQLFIIKAQVTGEVKGEFSERDKNQAGQQRK